MNHTLTNQHTAFQEVIPKISKDIFSTEISKTQSLSFKSNTSILTQNRLIGNIPESKPCHFRQNSGMLFENQNTNPNLSRNEFLKSSLCKFKQLSGYSNVNELINRANEKNTVKNSLQRPNMNLSKHLSGRGSSLVGSQTIQDKLASVFQTEPSQLSHVNLKSNFGMLQEYVPAIFNHYKINANKNKVNPFIISEEFKSKLENKMKLFEVIYNFCSYFNLQPRTFFTANNIFDRYIHSLVSYRDCNPTLIAVASFFIAAKYEEIYPPSLQEVCQLLKNRYSREAVIEMEGQIIGILDFNFVYVCPLDIMELMTSQWNLRNKETLFTSVFILKLFCFDVTIDSQNVFKLAIFAIGIAQRIIKDQFCFKTDTLITSEDNFQFLRSLKKIITGVEIAGLACFDMGYHVVFQKLKDFVKDKIGK